MDCRVRPAQKSGPPEPSESHLSVPMLARKRARASLRGAFHGACGAIGAACGAKAAGGTAKSPARGVASSGARARPGEKAPEASMSEDGSWGLTRRP